VLRVTDRQTDRQQYHASRHHTVWQAHSHRVWGAAAPKFVLTSTILAAIILRYTVYIGIGVTYGEYGGYAYPHFLEWGVRDFPSSSAHVSPYNIQENVWRLRFCPRNRVHRYSTIAKGGAGAQAPKGCGKNCTTVLAVQKGQI